MAIITPVDPGDAAAIARYAEMVRRANAEDFGEFAQRRSNEEFANEITSADGTLEWFVMTLSQDDPEVLAAIDVAYVDDTRGAVFIRVLKAVQGYGFGRYALEFALQRLRQRGITTVLATCSARSARDNRNVRFLLKSGFEEIIMLLRQDVSLRTDPALWEVPPLDGIVIETVSSHFSDDLLTAVVECNRHFALESPTMAPPALQVEDGPGLAALYNRMRAGGRHIVLATATAPDGSLVGYCETQVGKGDRFAEQYTTYVAPEHRHRGVSRALKAAMLKEVRRLAPGTEAVRVYLPAEFTSVAATNRSLGYVDTLFYREWKRELA